VQLRTKGREPTGHGLTEVGGDHASGDGVGASAVRPHAAVAAPGQSGIDAENKHSFDRNLRDS
jgi:hypothetical protein